MRKTSVNLFIILAIFFAISSAFTTTQKMRGYSELSWTIYIGTGYAGSLTYPGDVVCAGLPILEELNYIPEPPDLLEYDQMYCVSGPGLCLLSVRFEYYYAVDVDAIFGEFYN